MNLFFKIVKRSFWAALAGVVSLREGHILTSFEPLHWTKSRGENILRSLIASFQHFLWIIMKRPTWDNHGFSSPIWKFQTLNLSSVANVCSYSLSSKFPISYCFSFSKVFPEYFKFLAPTWKFPKYCHNFWLSRIFSEYFLILWILLHCWRLLFPYPLNITGVLLRADCLL